MKTVKCICKTCGKCFIKQPSQIKGKKYLYCSMPCYREGKRTLMISGEYKSGRISDEKLLRDMFDLADKLGRRPSAKDVNELNPGRNILYSRRFGSVSNAFSLCGSSVKTVTIQNKKRVSKGTSPRYTPQQLIQELRRVAESLGHTPTDSEFRKHGNCSSHPYWRAFNSWSAACEAAGLAPHTTLEGGVYPTRYYEHVRPDGKLTKLQGSYEYRFAKVLDTIKEKWLCHGEFSPLRYLDFSGKSHKYTPDFYIPSIGLYVEIKGYFRDDDKTKMEFVIDQNPELRISIVNEKRLASFEKTFSLDDIS